MADLSTSPQHSLLMNNLEDEATPSGEQSSPPVPKTAKQLAARRNQERIKSILLLAIPDEYLLKFHNVPDAKSLWAAINRLIVEVPILLSQNLAFLSSENTNSTNEVSTASGEFGQMDGDDLEELDLRWQVAMLTVRVKKFIQRTGRNMDFKEKRHVSLDKSKIECYNCHRKGHFARECRSGRSQGRRPYGDRSNAQTTESSSQALVAQDGLGGYDWSNDFEVEPVNYALMAISSSNSSSSSDSEHNKAKLEIRGYEIALESLEARILGHEKNELAWGERYEFQNYDLKCREIKINNLNLELEKVVKERDELKLKIEKWEGSSKNLTKILNSQMSTHDKNGLGSSDEESTLENNRFTKVNEYHVVPPPITGNPLTPRPDISFAGLDKYAFRNKIIESKTTKTNKTVGTTNEATIVKPKSVNETVMSKSKINRDEVIIEDWTSDDEDDVCADKTVSSVKPNVTQAVRSQADKSGQTLQKQGIGFKKNVVTTGERVVKKPGFGYGKKDYKDLNGGFVAFGSDPKGGKITGKGKIKTANLDFDDVYFVDELKFNLFFVSQMCDKKNSVLFTESECLILSPSFKLLDDKEIRLFAWILYLYVMPLKYTNQLGPKGLERESALINCLEINQMCGRNLSKLDVDLDFLTNSMNYIPVSVENWYCDAGTQDSYVAGSSGKDKRPTQEYILLPLQPHRIRIPAKDVVQDAQEQPSKNASPDKGIQVSEDVFDKEGQHQMPADEQDWQDELEMMVTQELVANAMNDESRQAFEEEKRRIASQKKAAQATSTNQLSIDRPFVSTDRLFVSTDRSNTPNVSAASTSTGANADESSFVYLEAATTIPIDASTLPNADLSIDPNMPDLEDASDILLNDGIINGAYDDDEYVGAVADFNNMDNTIANITKPQGSSKLFVCMFSLSRRTQGTISQALKDESWVEAMQEELLQFKLQQVWILVDLPFGKKAIGTKWVFRNKRDKRSIVVKNKAKLVAQGHRQEEGIDYAEVFAPVARIGLFGLHSPEPRVKNVVNTGKRVVKPVWDYGKRVNHQNFSKNLKYPYAKRTFNPSAVLTRASLVNTIRSNVSTARFISTVRPVYTVRPVRTTRPLASKIAQSNSIIRPKHPRLDIVRPKASNTQIKRSYFTQPVYRPKDLKPYVKTFGIKNMTTIGTRAVVSKGKVENVLKKDKWVWRPKMNYQDHVYKYNGSYMLKKFEYGNPEILLQDHAVVDSGCSSHMTGNKAYLSDYEDFNGGFVAFGSDPKGVTFEGRISMDLRMDRCSAGKFYSYMVFHMANLKYSDKHNMVAFLKKPNESVGFTEVVDFLKGTSLRYALTHNPTIYDSLVKQFWQTATVRTLANGTQQLVASIDSKEYTITEASFKSKLQLADATVMHNLSDAEIYHGLATLGGYARDIIPLLLAMLAWEAMDQGEGSAQPAEPHHTPVDPISSTSQPPIPSPPHPSPPPHSPLQSPPHSPPHFSPPRSYEAPLPEGNTSGSAEDSMQLKELMVLVPTLVTRINSLEKELKDTKQTLGNDVLKLVKKVKSLETALKRKSKKVLISESKGEEPKDQGRIIQD
ncbi:ribonuclease H-like domain-containing protein [Tanacetum coccineum]